LRSAPNKKKTEKKRGITNWSWWGKRERRHGKKKGTKKKYPGTCNEERLSRRTTIKPHYGRKKKGIEKQNEKIRNDCDPKLGRRGGIAKDKSRPEGVAILEQRPGGTPKKGKSKKKKTEGDESLTCRNVCCSREYA